jgi:hypothetical protein
MRGEAERRWGAQGGKFWVVNSHKKARKCFWGRKRSMVERTWRWEGR